MSQRDELAREIFNAPARIAWNGEQQAIAAALITAGYYKPRTIRTADELEQVKLPAIILDVNGQPMIFQYMYGPSRTKYLEYITGDDEYTYRPNDMAQVSQLPATVICEDF